MKKLLCTAAMLAAMLHGPMATAQITLGPANPLFEADLAEVQEALDALLDGYYARASALATPVAEAGNPVAQNLLGALMIQPTQPEFYDPATAITWLMRSAAQGYDKAWHNIGDTMNEDHPGLAPNYMLGIAAYQIAVDLGYVASHSELGWMLMFSDAVRAAGLSDEPRGLEIVRQGLGIDPNDTALLNVLGDSYYYGAGQPKDLRMALELYLQTANLGDAFGQFSSAYQYYTGEGTVTDYQLAQDYFDQAAAQDYPRAFGYLSEIHLYGISGQVDPARAFDYATRGDALGDGLSAVFLGYMYRDGEGTEQDLTAARAAYERGRDRGNPDAHFQLGDMAYFGLGEDQDYAKAFGIYQDVLETDPDFGAASYSIAYMMMRGEGTPVDIIGSVPFLERAIAARDDSAMQEAVMLFGSDAFAGAQTDKPRAMAHCLYSIDAGLLSDADATHEVLQTCAALQQSLDPSDMAAAAALAEAL